MELTPLPLTVCLLDADPVAVANLAAAFAPVASEILTAVTPAGETVPTPWHRVATTSDVMTVAGLNELTARATQPWVLVVPPGMRPVAPAIPWLQQHLPTLAPGQYIGLSPVPGRADTMRPWLFAERLQWWDGPPLRLGGDRGEDLPVTLLPSLAFKAPAALPEWFGIDEADLCRHIGGLQGVLQRFPNSVRAHFELAECLRFADRHLEAYAVLQRAWENPKVRGHWVPGELPGLLARVASDLGQTENALGFARLAIAEQPNQVIAWELLVRLRYASVGAAAALVEAEGWWEACLSGAPGALRTIAEQPVVMAEACRHLVWSRTAAGRLADARDIASLGEAPPDLPVHVAIESGLLDAAIDLLVSHQQEPAIARRSWDRLLASSRDMPDLIRGMIWSSLKGDYYRKLALECFDRVVDAHPDRVEGYWRRAMVLATRPQGLLPAKNDLYKALRLEPRWDKLWFKLAEVCRLLGDEPGAQAAFREAHRLAASPFGR